MFVREYFGDLSANHGSIRLPRVLADQQLQVEADRHFGQTLIRCFPRGSICGYLLALHLLIKLNERLQVRAIQTESFQLMLLEAFFQDDFVPKADNEQVILKRQEFDAQTLLCNSTQQGRKFKLHMHSQLLFIDVLCHALALE